MEGLKVCPFCGGEAEINKNPLWRGTHGYKGCYEFVAVCKKCGCRVDHIKNDSIYRSEEEAQENVIKAWNKRVLQTQDVPDTDVGNTISRQAAIDALDTITMYKGSIPHDTAVMKIEQLPSARPEGIPLEWINKHLEWLDNCDNDFAQLAKVSIRGMVEIWKKDRI